MVSALGLRPRYANQQLLSVAEAFGESWNLLDKDDMSYGFIKVMKGGFETHQIRKFFHSILQLIPPKNLALLSPDMKVLFGFKDV